MANVKISPQTTRNALEPFSASGAKSFSLPFPTGLLFNQLLLYASTQHFWASRPSVLSLKKTSLRHKRFSVYSWSSVRRPPLSTRLLWTLCVYPISSCLKLSTVYTRLLNVSLLAWNYRKHIAQTDGRLCVCYINLCSSISRVPKAHIAAFFWNWLVFCSIRPILRPFQCHFLCDLLRFRSP